MPDMKAACGTQRIGLVRCARQRGLQQTGLLDSRRHALTIDRIETSDGIIDRDQAAR
jgi:hypothetical protein